MQQLDIPFPVIIVQDFRDSKPSGDLGGHAGVHLGIYRYPGEGFSNPLIITPGGEYIWGIESYWRPLGQLPGLYPSDLVVMCLNAHYRNLVAGFRLERGV
ncbi:hypothetical protein HYV82_03380 [Candidatus Woesearchaeota archaeon]|nr:hypothetical protein [Candidatus Woesearchaeota archaeon]